MKFCQEGIQKLLRPSDNNTRIPRIQQGQKTSTFVPDSRAAQEIEKYRRIDVTELLEVSSYCCFYQVSDLVFPLIYLMNKSGDILYFILHIVYFFVLQTFIFNAL